METFTIVLDWIGAFFLSVEAMKLKNFTLIMKKLRIALNPPYYHKEDGSTLIPTPAPEYSGIRKILFFYSSCIWLLFHSSNNWSYKTKGLCFSSLDKLLWFASPRQIDFNFRQSRFRFCIIFCIAVFHWTFNDKNFLKPFRQL